MKNIFLLIAVILSGCSSADLADQKVKKATLYYAEGTDNLIQQNYTAALNNLLKAEENDPKRSDIQNHLGMAYFYKKNTTLALKHIQRAIELEPKNSEALSNLALIYFELKNYKKAKAYYLKVSQDLTYDKQHLTYHNLGVLELRLNNSEEAKKYFKLSINENNQSCSSHFQLGLMSFERQNYQEALIYFKNAYNGICYKNDTPLYYQAQTFEKLNQPLEARKKYKELLERFPRSNYLQIAKSKIFNLADEKSLSDEKLYSELQNKMKKNNNNNGNEIFEPGNF